jgi:hypothetical protein
MSNDTLIDRYVYEVGEQLPQQTGEDVKLELHSALYDALEERGLDATNREDQEEVVKLLKEFGRPDVVAQSYGARNYLLGPELFPYYKQALRVAVTVITLIHLLLMALAALDQPDVGALFRGALGNYINALLFGFGFVTLVFVMLERLLTKSDLSIPDWDPRKLPSLRSRQGRVNPFEIIVELFFLTVFIVFVNLIPGWAEPGGWLAERWEQAALFVNRFAPFIPWFTAIWLAEFALKAIVLVRGHWNTATRWLDFALTVAGFALIVTILTTVRFPEAVLVDWIVRTSLVVAFVIAGWEVVSTLYRLLRPKADLPGDRGFDGS